MKNTKVETFQYLIFLSYILVYTNSHTSLGEPFENEVVDLILASSRFIRIFGTSEANL